MPPVCRRGARRVLHGVGIVAESFPQAMAARRALRVTWSKNKVDNFDSEKALERYAAIHADAAAPVKIVEAKGDVKAAFDGAAKTYKAEFRSDYTYHAQLEPLNAVARFNDAGDRVEVWDGSQDLGRSRDLVAKTLGMKPEQVDVHQCYLGGGFGRRSLADYAAEAAVLAREVKRPVKLVWTREEDVAHGMVPAHVKELNEIGWNAKTDELSNGVKLTVIASDAQPLTKLKALGFMGIMVQGGHHQPHHLLMAKGQPMH